MPEGKTFGSALKQWDGEHPNLPPLVSECPHRMQVLDLRCVFFLKDEVYFFPVYTCNCISIIEKLGNTEDYEVGKKCPKHPSPQILSQFQSFPMYVFTVHHLLYITNAFYFTHYIINIFSCHSSFRSNGCIIFYFRDKLRFI